MIQGTLRRPSARALRLSLALLVGLTSATSAAESASIPASKDNTLYEEGGISNGAGQHFFVGRTGHETRRRGLIAFDIAGSIPAGSTIQGVTLRLHMSRSGTGSPAAMIELHRATADWGEGTSVAATPEGIGAAATPGDATWANSFFPNDFWVTPGGEYLSTAGAAVNVSDPDFYTWGSTESLVSGVQSWLDSPQTNFGWVLIAQNESVRNARRFDTRENATSSFRPVLQVTYALLATDGGFNAGMTDGGRTDAGGTDGGSTDAGAPDSGQPDAGSTSGGGASGTGSGCSCLGGSSSLTLAVMLTLSVALGARRCTRTKALSRSPRAPRQARDTRKASISEPVVGGWSHGLARRPREPTTSGRLHWRSNATGPGRGWRQPAYAFENSLRALVVHDSQHTPSIGADIDRLAIDRHGGDLAARTR